MSEETTKTLIQNLPQILTAAGTFLVAVTGLVLGILNYRKNKATDLKVADAKADAAVAIEAIRKMRAETK